MVETAKKPKGEKHSKKGASNQKKEQKQKPTSQSEEDQQPPDAEKEEQNLQQAASQVSNPQDDYAQSSQKSLPRSIESVTKSSKQMTSKKLSVSQPGEPSILRGSMKFPTTTSLGITDQQKSVLFMTPDMEQGQFPASSSQFIANKILDDSSPSSSSSEDAEDEEEEEEKQEKKDKKKKKKEKHPEDLVAMVKMGSSMQMRKSKSKARKKEDVKMASVDKNLEQSRALIEKSKLKALPRFASILHSGSIYSKDGESLQEQKKHKKGKGKGKRKASPRKGDKKDKLLSQKLKEEQEEEAKKKAEEEKIRLEQERRAAVEKAKRELLEHQMREDQLGKCFNHLQVMIDNDLEMAKKKREQEQWEFYLKCGKLPDVFNCGAVTTYLHLWKESLQKSTIKDVSERTKEVLELLENIEDVYNSPIKIDETKLENFNWIYQLLRESLADNLTFITLQLISNIETNLRRIDPRTADFNFQDENLTFNIWLRVPTPICLPNPRKPNKPKIEINFTNLDMTMIFPLCIPALNMAVRVMHLKYDHLSDRCENYYMPETSVREPKTLLEVTDKEWQIKQIYSTNIVDQDDEVSQLLASTKSNLFSEKSLSFTLKDVSSSVACLVEEFLEYEEDKKLLEVPEQFYAVNMRKYRVIGGIYYINLLRQPLQPQHLVTVNLTTAKNFLPKRLDEVDYRETVTLVKRVSSVRASRSSVVSELIMNKRTEEEQEKRIMVLLKLPSDVVFFEPPNVVYWDEDANCWSDEVEDVENKGDTIAFRIQTYGAFGLVTNRYNNLPYEHWIIKPSLDGSSIDFEIRTRMMELLLRVKGDAVSLVQAVKSPNDKAFEFMLNKPMKLYKMINRLRNIGVDIFPEFDAFLYVEPNYEKQWAMEKHLYLDMARLSHTFKFARSKWNSQAGFRNIILQMKEINPTKTMQKCLLNVTPLKATILRNTENAANMTLDEADNIRFSADLYHLMKVTSGIAVRKMIEDASLQTTMGVYNLLKATRFLSYS